MSTGLNDTRVPCHKTKGSGFNTQSSPALSLEVVMKREMGSSPATKNRIATGGMCTVGSE